MRGRLDAIAKRLDGLEAEAEPAAAEDTPGPEPSGLGLLGLIEVCLHPKRSRVMNDQERRYFWPWWQLLQILSDDFWHLDRPHLGQAAESVEAAVLQWAGDLCAVAWPSRNPINAITLHAMKFKLRTDMNFVMPGDPQRDEEVTRRWWGINRAEQIDYLFASDHSVPPWHRDFKADPADWPEANRDEILRRLALSRSVVPDVVEPFDWRDVHAYELHCVPPRPVLAPFPRDADGRPLPQVFETDDDQETT